MIELVLAKAKFILFLKPPDKSGGKSRPGDKSKSGGETKSEGKTIIINGNRN